MASRHNDNKVLGCVDQSVFAEYVTDYAAWTAQRLGAPLELLHILDRKPEVAQDRDHSGAIGLDAQENLLTTLSDADATRSRSARAQGREFLNGLRQRAQAAGVPAPDMRLRYGNVIETLKEQEAGVRLFVLGRRGESATITQRDLGRHVEKVVRTLEKPILAVNQAFVEPRRIMIAFDGSTVTRAGVRLVASSPMFRGMTVHLLMSGKDNSEARKQLAWAQQTLEGASFDAPTAFIPGDAESVIAREIKAQGIDMLVMGAYSHSPLRSLFMGSKTTDLLRSSVIPTMLLR
jgi:nucleotide-binding universal stress UspA family protein